MRVLARTDFEIFAFFFHFKREIRMILREWACCYIFGVMPLLNLNILANLPIKWAHLKIDKGINTRLGRIAYHDMKHL